jgi:hypothetical protein
MKLLILLCVTIVTSVILLQLESCATMKEESQSMTYEEHPLPTLEQEPPKQVETPQVMVAVQNSSLPGESESYTSMIGFQAGFIMPITRIHNLISIRGELNGSLQGANYSDYGMDGKVSLVYITVPLVARYKTKNGFFGEAGIQPGFCVSAKDKFNDNTSNYKKYINTFDFGIPFGIGYEFKKNFGVGFRVIAGLTNINSESTYKDHNLVMALRGTYNLQFKKK